MVVLREAPAAEDPAGRKEDSKSATTASALQRYENDATRLRRAFSRFPSGVVALTVELDGEPKGFVASSFTVGISMEPPLVSVAVQNSSTTWPELKRASRIGVSVLGADQEALCLQLAAKSRVARFTGIRTVAGTGEALFIPGAALWLECTILGEVPAGDHHVVLLQVEAIAEHPNIAPLVFHGSRFHKVLVPE